MKLGGAKLGYKFPDWQVEYTFGDYWRFVREGLTRSTVDSPPQIFLGKTT